jgi:hypothetical protein
MKSICPLHSLWINHKQGEAVYNTHAWERLDHGCTEDFYEPSTNDSHLGKVGKYRTGKPCGQKQDKAKQQGETYPARDPPEKS